MQSQHTEAELILSRFPGPVTLYSSRRKWLLLLLFCYLTSAAGMLLVLYGSLDGWFFLVFFGAISILPVGMLLPGASALELDGEGFVATRFYQRHRARWRDVKRFAAHVQYPGWPQRMVVYDDINAPDTLLARLNKTIGDHNAFLPDTYGFPGDELAWLMSQWRERATERLLN